MYGLGWVYIFKIFEAKIVAIDVQMNFARIRFGVRTIVEFGQNYRSNLKEKKGA